MPERKPDDQYDFFVSYARMDNAEGWITRFIEALQEEHQSFTGGREFSVFFDTSEIRSLDDWRHRLYEGLAASRLLVAFISPHYFASEWCQREWRTWIDLEIAKHILSEGAATVYIIEVPWLYADLGEQEVAEELKKLSGDPTLAGIARELAGQIRQRQQLEVHQFYDEGLEALRREDLRKILENLAHDLDERARRVVEAEASPNTVPAYNRRFTGRLAELTRLRELLDDDRAGVVTGVHGLGGVGKTELAFTYAHAYASLYPGGRYLLPCEGRSSLREAALALDAEFRDQIANDERQTLDTHFAAIQRCLRNLAEEKGRILLVLDNVDRREALAPAETDALSVTPGKIHLLATTRLGPSGPTVGGRVDWLTLDALPDTDALALLEKHRPFPDETEREAANRIVRRLGGFTLTVELVAAWLEQHPEVSCAAFLERLGLEELEALEDLGGDPDIELRRKNDEHRLSAVLGPTLASLEPTDRAALKFAALMAPDQVALPWLRKLVGKKFSEFAEEPPPGYPDPWLEVERRLFSLALFTRSQEEDGDARLVRCHRLVQEQVRQGSDLESDALALSELIEERVAKLEKTTRWEEARWELKPLDGLANLWAESGKDRAAWLLNAVGLRWHDLAEWSRAEPLFRRALEIDEAASGPDHPSVATALNNLAELLRATNRLAEAEPLYRRALEIYEAAYGPDHPNVATGLNSLAFLLKDTNRLAEAEPLMRRALEIYEATLGPDHPRFAAGLSNLAGLLKATNRLDEAEPLIRRALEVNETAYGPDHPSVAIGLNNLALLLQDTNRLDEAEPLFRRALEIDEAAYGPDHPSVATALNNLAELLRATNRLAEAEPLYRRALEIDEASYGPDHPSVAIGLNNLALLLQDTNRLDEAEPLFRRALEIYEAAYGPDHPDVAASLGNLGECLRLLDRLDDAESLLRRAIEIDATAMGTDHPFVAIDGYKLAMLEHRKGNAAEAQRLLEQSLEVFRKSYGDDNHPKIQETFRRMKEIGMDPPE